MSSSCLPFSWQVSILILLHVNFPWHWKGVHVTSEPAWVQKTTVQIPKTMYWQSPMCLFLFDTNHETGLCPQSLLFPSELIHYHLAKLQPIFSFLNVSKRVDIPIFPRMLSILEKMPSEDILTVNLHDYWRTNTCMSVSTNSRLHNQIGSRHI
jgi:hypothetical protein